MITEEDLGWMRRALRRATEAAAFASPNPAVGCVLVRDGVTVGEGAHRYDERDHAEIVALKEAAARGQQVSGATAYATLEPCSHHGRTGPCADALVRAGVARCVVATVDPNPVVRGNGLAKLRAGGVLVDVLSAGLEETSDAAGTRSAADHGEKTLAWEARRLNDAFAFAIQHGRPFVTLKAAVSAEGMLAPAQSARAAGKPHWLTGDGARADVQRLRHESDAVLTGIGTVLADDPALTDRTGLPRRRPLLRMVLDGSLRIPLSSRLEATAADDLLVLCGEKASVEREAQLKSGGVDVVRLPALKGRLDLQAMMQVLQERGVRSVLAEAGFALNGALLQARLVDKVVLYSASTELGQDAVPFAEGQGSPYALHERLSGMERVAFAHGREDDVRVSGYLQDPWANVSV